MVRNSNRQQIIKASESIIDDIINAAIINDIDYETSSDDDSVSHYIPSYLDENCVSSNSDSSVSNDSSSTNVLNTIVDLDALSHCEDDASSSEDEIDGILNPMLVDLESIHESRYLPGTRSNYRTKAERRSDLVFHTILHDDMHMNNREFLRFFRFSRNVVRLIADKIRHRPVFTVESKKPQALPEYQLMVFLYYAGQTGNGNSSEISLYTSAFDLVFFPPTSSNWPWGLPKCANTG